MLLHATTLAALDNRTSGPNKDHSAPRRRHRQQVQCLWARFDCSSLESCFHTYRLSRTRTPVKLSWAGTAKRNGRNGYVFGRACRVLLGYACRCAVDGSTTRNVVPAPSTDSTSIEPPLAFITSRQV